MQDWKKNIDNIQQKRKAAQALDENLYAAKLNLQKLVTAMREGNSHSAEEKLRLQKEISRLKGSVATAKTQLSDAINIIFETAQPGAAVAQLDDSVPFLLFPVRMETRFMNTGQQAELWVRIYPDEISIQTHEKVLTDTEVAAAEEYWTVLFNAEKSGAADKENRKKAAWSKLVEKFTSQRAAWIALQTKPLNWSADLQSVPDAASLDFPEQDLTKTASWSRAPRCRSLPDKFVVQLYTGTNLVIEQELALVPDELYMGPDPMEADAAFREENNKLLFGADFDWTADFPKAVKLGMGGIIPLNADQAVRGFDRILVIGAFVSADAAQSKLMLEELLDNHHYSPDGLSILPQGTATNNTDANGAGYAKKDPFGNISYLTDAGEPLFDANTDCDGRNLANALGIGYTTLQYVGNADLTDNREAVAMNKVLYPATLGYYFSQLLKPVLGDQTQDLLREFFTEHVTGRGPLPALRVGDQPYAVLLTSDFSKWQLTATREHQQRSFYDTLLKVLRYYEGVFRSLVPALNYAGKAGTDPAAVLMEILGMQAGSVEFFQRNAYSSDDLRNKAGFLQGQRYFDELSKSNTSKNILLTFFTNLGLNIGNIPGFTIPQLLRLIFQHYASRLDASNLIDAVALSEQKGIREYAPGAAKNYLDWLAAANDVNALEQQDFGAGVTPPNQLLYLLARKALLEQIHQSSAKWLIKRNFPVEASTLVRNFHNIRPEADLSKWEVMKAPVKLAEPQHPHKELALGAYLWTVGINEEEAAYLKELRQALDELKKLPTARLERCFTEHIDACTYRLDAWQTALFKLRLAELRQSATNDNGDQQRSTGIYLGAYGWLENVRPSPKQQVPADIVPEPIRPADGSSLYIEQDNGGFVHAPSLNHAAAASVLRSGYLAHADSATPDTLAVNLSSERVRRALFILEGMQNGQTIEALLGYQFERGLHDRASANNQLLRLNGYIYDFRAAFPIEKNMVKQQGDSSAAISIPATDVVNGVALAEYQGSFPFGAKGAVESASTGEQAAINAEKDRLADTLDAVKDVLTSESVYQLVLGNFDRASAVLNAMQEAKIPPVLDVIDTPRSSHFTFTNRVTIQFEKLDPAQPASNPWPSVPMTDRAVVEPGLNKWAAGFMPEPAALFCRVAHSDAAGHELGFALVNATDLQLQPLDYLCILGNESNTGSNSPGEESKTGASELEMRIADFYRQQKSLPDAQAVQIQFQLNDRRCFGEILPLLRKLKSLVIDARPLHAEDFCPTTKKPLGDPANPQGYDLTEMNTRIVGLRGRADILLTNLRSVQLQTQITEADGTVLLFSDLGDAADALDAQQREFTDAVITFQDPDVLLLQYILRQISLLGIPDSFPLLGGSTNDAGKLTLLAQGRAVIHQLTKAVADAKASFDKVVLAAGPEEKMSLYTASAKAILSGAFMLLPQFTYNNKDDIRQSHLAEADLLQHAGASGMLFPVDEWLQSTAHVRKKLERWETIRSLDEVINGHADPLNVVQLPFREKDSWVAVSFPATYNGFDENGDPAEIPFTISQDTLSVVVHGAAAFDTTKTQSGLLLDEWTEQIPAAEEITGIGFNYNRPDAMPPQALLLAVTPAVTGNWSWEKLVGIVNDTFDRAKQRAVDTVSLDAVNSPQTSILLPAILSNFTQYDLDISLDLRLNVKDFAAKAPVMTAFQYQGGNN